MAELDKNFLKDLVEIAKEFFNLTKKDLDPHTKKKGSVVLEKGKITLLTPSHIQFAKYGRGPGKKPPLDAILEFVSSEGISCAGSSMYRPAFAIQAKIGKKGTSNWVPNAPNALEEALDKNYQKYAKELSDSVSIKISDEVNKIYKDIKPNEKFKI